MDFNCIMDSVIMTTPGNGPRLKSRLRSAANAICARSSKNHNIHHTYPKISASSHQNFNNHSRHKAIAFVFSNNTACKSLQKSGSISTGNLKKTLLSSEANVKSWTPSKEKTSEDDVAVSGESSVEDASITDSECCSIRFGTKFSREVQEVWCSRVGLRHKLAPADSLQSLFNDISLYPSKAQVFEMLVIARQSARRTDLSMAFGEFCFLAAQLRRHTIKIRLSSSTIGDLGSSTAPLPDVKNVTCQVENGCKTIHRTRSESGTQQESQQGQPQAQQQQPHPYEVFLGGSCNPTTWRSDVAIPALDKMGITYYNPQVDDWSYELIDIEHHAKQSARVLFFVMDADTRATAAAVEAAHLSAAPRPLVLVLQPYRRGQRIGGEVITDQEYLDLSRGQAILQEVAERRNLPVFTELEAALRYTYQLLRGGRPYNPNATTPSVATHLKKARDAFDAADENKTGKLSPLQTLNVLRSYTGIDLSLAHVENLIQMVLSQSSSKEDHLQTSESSASSTERRSSVDGQEVTFELFCLLVSEVMEEMEIVNTDSIWSPDYVYETPEDLDDLEHNIRMLLRWEARVLLESLDPIYPKSQHTTDSSVVQDKRGEDQPNDPRWCSSGSAVSKWRYFLRNVQTAISSFVSKIEFNSSRSTEDVPSVMSTRRHHSPQSSNNTSPTRKCGTTYSRRREQDGANTRQKQRHSIATDEEKIERVGVEATRTSPAPSTGMAKGRKLSVIIPKVPVVEIGNSAGAVLTPSTTQRLEGLAGSVRDEPMIRDVYLGGSCVVRTSWRENTVIPMLKKHNLTYYKPELNDYNRIFSAPPYTPANGGRFSFDDVVSYRSGSNNGLHRQNSNGKSMQKTSRSTNKHERSPNTSHEGDQPEKKPKYSTRESESEKDDVLLDDVEVRQRDGPYPLQSGNRLSASDFYKISGNATPDPFRGMFDERQVHGSRVLLFGVTNDTRCLSPMVLASHCIGLRPRAVVLCVQLLQHTDGLSERAVKDYNRGRLYLKDLAIREGVPVFDNMEEATQCVIKKLGSGDY